MPQVIVEEVALVKLHNDDVKVSNKLLLFISVCNVTTIE